MTRIKQWIVDKFLPAYARDALLEENARLQKQITTLTAEIDRLQSYSAGVRDAMRSQRRIVIQTGGKA